MAAHSIENAQTLSQVPACPLCHRTDQVQKMQTAYERGWVQVQSPPLSRRAKKGWLWVLVAVLIYGGANFYLFAQLGGGPGFGSWPLPLQILEVVIIEGVLIIGLLFSILAFARLINTRQETVWRYPAHEEDHNRWQNLYHCRRDNVIFDAQRQEVLSQAETERRLRVLPPEPGHPTVEER
jgi:hypothetical protein